MQKQCDYLQGHRGISSFPTIEIQIFLLDVEKPSSFNALVICMYDNHLHIPNNALTILSPFSASSPLISFAAGPALHALRQRLPNHPKKGTGNIQNKEHNSRKEKEFDRNRQPSMQSHHRNQQSPTNLRLRPTNNRPQIPRQKHHAHRKPHGHKHIIEYRHGAPTDQRHRDPYRVRIPIQCVTFNEIDTPARRLPQRGARGAPVEPFERAPQPDGHKSRIPIHQPRGPAQQAEIVDEGLVVVGGEVLAYRPRQKKYEDDGRGDPEGTVEIGVAV